MNLGDMANSSATSFLNLNVHQKAEIVRKGIDVLEANRDLSSLDWLLDILTEMEDDDVFGTEGLQI